MHEYKMTHLKCKLCYVSVLAYGIGSVVFAFICSTLWGHMRQVSISFSDSVACPMMGLFIFGAFFRRTNWLVNILHTII